MELIKEIKQKTEWTIQTITDPHKFPKSAIKLLSISAIDRLNLDSKLQFQNVLQALNLLEHRRPKKSLIQP